MRHSQRGVTFIGWLVLLVPVAIVVYAGIRLAPDLPQLHAGRQVAVRDGRARPGVATPPMPSRCVTHWKSTSISKASTHPTTKDVDIHRENEHWVAIVDYEDVAPVFANISMLVQFHKVVVVQ